MYYEVTTHRPRLGRLGATRAPQYLDGDCVMNCDLIGQQPPPPVRTAQQLLTSCNNIYETWARNNAALAACMNASDRQKFLDVCLRVYRGELASAARPAKIKEITDAACARSRCDAAALDYYRRNPQAVTCTTGTARSAARDRCIADQLAGRDGS